MLVVLSLLLAAYCLLQCIIASADLRRHFLKFLLFAAIGLIHGLVPAVSSMLDPTYGASFGVSAALYALLGTVVLSASWTLADWWHTGNERPGFQVAAAVRDDRLRARCEYVFWASAVLGVAAWLLQVAALGVSFGDLMNESRFAFRGSGNKFLVWLFSGLMSLAYVPGFLGFFISIRYRFLGILYALCYATVFYVISRGTRSLPIGLMGTTLCGYVLHRRLSGQRLVVVCATGVVLVTLVIGLYPLRHRMHSLSAGDMLTFLTSSQTYEEMLDRDPLNYHTSFLDVVECFPELHDYVHAASYRRVMFFYLPHAKFPSLKPEDPNRIVAEVLFDADPELDWMHPPSLFGDVYINFYGWWGILALAVHGVLLAVFSRWYRNSTLGLLVLGPNIVHYVLIGMRGQPFTLFIYLLTSCTYTALLLKVAGLPWGWPRLANRRRRWKPNGVAAGPASPVWRVGSGGHR